MTGLENSTLTVTDSNLGNIAEGTKLHVTRDHTNQFTGRRVITVEPDRKVKGRISGFQLQATDTKDVWKEIRVSGEGDTITVGKVLIQ